MALTDRIDALAEVAEVGRDALPADLLADVAAVATRAGHRERLSSDHTVVALAGATGSGKSSLANALSGTGVAEVGVVRPTTAEALALVRGEPGSGELLDWLGVARRHVLDPVPGTGSLVLLDLPDHDSVRREHRTEAERLVGLVDLMVWVLDPQKYADAAVHERYLSRLGGHRDVVLVVLNHVDRLDPAERRACRQDLERLLALDGLGGVQVIETSAITGEGVTALRRALEDAARKRQAARARIDADLAAVAGRVLEACGPEAPEPRAARTDLVEALYEASGAPLVVDAVRASWRYRAARATGWPPLRWLGRLRPDPVRRLHLDGRGDPELVRTSLPRPGTAELARMRGAVRDYTGEATAGLPPAWGEAARGATLGHGLPDALDHAVATTRLAARRPVTWGVLGTAQWVLLAVALAGGAWLGVIAAADALLVPLPDPPVWGTVPWPTVLLAGGVAGGLLLALFGSLTARVGARRRAAVAAHRLRVAVAEVADRLVIEPTDEVRRRRARCIAAARRAEGRRR